MPMMAVVKTLCLFIRTNLIPIGSMYGIFTYMFQPNVGKVNIPYMDPMGYVFCWELSWN